MRITSVMALVAISFAIPLRADPNDIMVDNRATASIRGATSLTFSFTVGSGSNRYLLVEVATGNGRSISSVTYGGTALTSFASVLTPGGKDRLEMFEMINPPSGTANVVITLGAGGGVNFIGGAISFNNVHQTTPRRATASASSLGLPGDKGTNPIVTVTSADRDAVVDGAISSTGTTAMTANASQFVQWNVDSNAGAGGGGETNLGCSVKWASSASTTMSWTLSQQDKWAILATSLIPALAPTQVRMLNAEAWQHGAVSELSWTTSFELDNLGFNVYRSRSGGPLEKVNRHLILGSALEGRRPSRRPRPYRWRDPDAGTGFVQYFIEDLDVHGLRTMHGPLSPLPGPAALREEAAGGAADPALLPEAASANAILVSPDGMGIPPDATAAPTNAQRQFDLAARRAAKLLVTSEGWVRVRRSDLQSAGFDPGSDPKALALFTGGIEVPVLVSDGGDGRFDPGDSIAFYGNGIDLPSTAEHAYWVVAGTGRKSRIAQAASSTTTLAPPTGFPYTYQRIERTAYFPVGANSLDRSDFFGAIVSPLPVTQELDASGLDATASGTAALELVLQGATLVGHTISLQLNGTPLSNISLSAQQRLRTTLQVPLSVLTAGTNTLTLTATGGDEDISVVQSLRLTYPHLYTAHRNALKCTVPGRTALRIGGFTRPGVTVLDVTNALRPVAVPSTLSASGGMYTVSFVVPDGTLRTILAVADDRVLSPARIVATSRSSWHDTANRASLVILANRAFAPAAAPLKALRDSEGTATLVVDVQEIYDEFGFGHRGPRPIRDFLLATQSWTVPPHFVILLGDASFDPRDYLGLGFYDFVPTMTVATTWIKTASDDWFADFSASGIPALAIGRLPARTAAEATAMIGKIVNRRSGGGTVQLFSDGADADYDFQAASARLAPLVPPPLTVETHDFAHSADARAETVASMNRGALLANYIGHGSVEIWSHSVYGTGDAMAATNATLPFVVVMNCLNGYFHDLYTTSLAEGLMLNPNGGAVAVWASSSLTEPAPQSTMNQELFRQLFTGTPAIGDALLRAKAATSDLDVRRSWIYFGDPSMRLR